MILDDGGDATLLLLVLAWPAIRPWVAALTSAGLSWAIEFAQLGDIPAVLRPLLGSTFNPPDLFWYAVGAALACAGHTRASGRLETRP